MRADEDVDDEAEAAEEAGAARNDLSILGNEAREEVESEARMTGMPPAEAAADVGDGAAAAEEKEEDEGPCVAFKASAGCCCGLRGTDWADCDDGDGSCACDCGVRKRVLSIRAC